MKKLISAAITSALTIALLHSSIPVAAKEAELPAMQKSSVDISLEEILGKVQAVPVSISEKVTIDDEEVALTDHMFSNQSFETVEEETNETINMIQEEVQEEPELPTETKEETEENKETETVVEVSKSGRYIYTSFGEVLDSKYCVSEDQVFQAVENACKQKEYHYATPALLEAIAYQESRFVSTAKNGSAVTMFQIKIKHYRSQLEALGLTEQDLTDVNNQAKFAAEVVEYIAIQYENQNLSHDDILRAMLCRYHLTTDSATKRIERKNWDSYTNSVMERMSKISENKNV